MKSRSRPAERLTQQWQIQIRVPESAIFTNTLILWNALKSKSVFVLYLTLLLVSFWSLIVLSLSAPPSHCSGFVPLDFYESYNDARAHCGDYVGIATRQGTGELLRRSVKGAGGRPPPPKKNLNNSIGMLKIL